jgi:hypothetical protein
MFWTHIEIGRHWWMMAHLLSEVQGFCPVVELPFTRKMLPKDRIQWFFNALLMRNYPILETIPAEEYEIRINKTLLPQQIVFPDHPPSEWGVIILDVT